MKHSAHPPHIVYIITKLELGGAQKICLSLMKYFSSQPGGASLISGIEGPLVKEVEKYASVYLLPSFQREVNSTGIFNEVTTFISIVKLLKHFKKKYHNIIVHTHSSKAGIIGRWAAWWAGISTVIHTVHGYGFHEFQPKPIWFLIYMSEYLTAHITSHFICVSEKDRATGVKLLPYFKQKNSIIRAAVEDHFFTIKKKTKKDKGNQDIIIGTISCLKPQKNLCDLLKAFKLVLEKASVDMRQRLKLHIIGDGIQRKMLHAWVLRNQIAPHIVFLGWQSDTSLWMKQWSIFSLSSLWEGLPCSVIEARLHKLPVIAYNTGGIHDVIKHGKNGFLVTPGHWQNLASRINQCIYDPDLLASLVSYSDALDDFHYMAMHKKHQEIYQLSSS